MKRVAYQLMMFGLTFTLLVGSPNIFDMNSLRMMDFMACETVEQCDAESSALARQKRRLQEKLKETKRQQDDLYEEMAILLDQVKLLDAELRTLTKGIEELLKQITSLEKHIGQKEGEVRKLLQQQQKETNNNIYLSMLLSAHSISDFVIKMGAVETINTAKQQYIGELQDDKMKLEESKGQLDEKREQAEASKHEQEALIEESKETLAKLNTLAGKMNDQIGDIEMSQEEIRKQRAIISGGVSSANGWYLPAATGWLTCTIGCYYDHIGNDFGMRVGTPVYAIADGTVIYTQRSTATTGYGTMITIAHNINGVPHISIYGHLSALGVRVGMVVRGGERIGSSGNTGASTGPHLHVEIVHSTNVFANKSFRRSHLVDALDVLPRPARGWSMGW
jgi:murein DD-endopeptidase MepM/ murein hydrolase activator NlpD